MRKTLLWFLHEVVTRGRLHEWRLEIPRAGSSRRRFTCRCGAEKLAFRGEWPAWR